MKAYTHFQGVIAGAMMMLLIFRIWPLPCAMQHASTLIPTRGDIQQRLIDEGYTLKLDCSMGPETNRAWADYEERTFSERVKP